MMSLMLTIFLTVSMMVMVNSNNPMKMSFCILSTSSIIFLLMKSKMGEAWMPSMFFILFTGGILMAFMILASILPNEKAKKIKMSKTVFVSMLLMYFLSSTKSLEMAGVAPQMKAFLTTGMTLSFMVAIILVYFFGSMSLNSVDNTSMRSVSCY